MFKELENWEMLSQVWFVHDYVQMQFHDDHTINIYNTFLVESGSNSYKQGEFGYADTLVGAIGSTISNVIYKESVHFMLLFSCGTKLKINLSKGLANSPEAFELNLSNGQHIELNT